MAEGATAEVFAACAGGAVLTGWALHLGAGPTTIGLLGALPLAAQILQLPAAWLTQRWGAKPVAVAAIAMSRLVWLPLIALPFLHLSQGSALAVFLGVVAVAGLFGVVGNNAWTVWMGDLVPGCLRGRFFGRRMVYLSATGTLASLAAGSALDALGPRGWRGETLGVLAAVACTAGVLSLGLLVRQHCPVRRRVSRAPRWSDVVGALHDTRARAFLRYLFTWNAAVGLSAGFFAFHMLLNLQMGFLLVAVHGVVVAVVRIVSAPAWGTLVDRHGARPVLVVTSFGIATIPMLWLLATPDRLWPIAVEAVVAGALWGGHGIATFDLSIGLAATNDSRPFSLAAFATAGGLGFAATSLVAGMLAEALRAPLAALGTSWLNIHVLLALSGAMRACASGLALRVHEPAATGVGELGRDVLRMLSRASTRLPRPRAAGV